MGQHKGAPEIGVSVFKITMDPILGAVPKDPSTHWLLGTWDWDLGSTDCSNPLPRILNPRFPQNS